MNVEQIYQKIKEAGLDPTQADEIQKIWDECASQGPVTASSPDSVDIEALQFFYAAAVEEDAKIGYTDEEKELIDAMRIKRETLAGLHRQS